MTPRTLFAPLLALVLAAPLSAQITPFGWIGDDGMDIGCCTPVNQTNVPQFPSFTITGLYCCIRDCNLEQEFQVRVTTQHIPIVCDLALIPFSVIPGVSGGPGWVGTLIAKYSRTWVELNADGTENQVWRWMVNTDAFATAGSAPCPIPPHPANIATHFTGNVDYACVIDPTTGTLAFRMAMNLNHLPGCISHNVFSASPLLPPPAVDGHHDRSYHLVAPGSFVCQPVPPPVGQTRGEAVRSTFLPPLPYTCLGELDLEGGEVTQPLAKDCLCQLTPGSGPFLWDHQFLRGFAFCPTPPITGASYLSLPIGPPAPPLPTGFTTFPVGSWIGTDPFPGSRNLSIHFGLLQYQDPCNPNLPPFHIVNGVSTTGPDGFVFGGLAPGPFRVFMDLQNMILANGLFGPYSLGFGTWFLSGVVWNLNL